MTAIALTLQVQDPIQLGATNIVTPEVELDPVFLASEAAKFEAGDKDKLDSLQLMTFGAKQTGVDAGVLFQQAIDDDYLYVCVVAGVAGVAVWKKTLLFNT